VIFIFPITTPASTPATAKLSTTLPLTAGKITGVGIQFPPGLCGFAHIAINQGLHQLYPANAEAAFATSEETINFAEDLDLEASECALTAYTWNEDNTYAHTITVRITLMPAAVEASWWEQAKELLGMQGGV
jgi:hypothetical protein